MMSYLGAQRLTAQDWAALSGKGIMSYLFIAGNNSEWMCAETNPTKPKGQMPSLMVTNSPMRPSLVHPSVLVISRSFITSQCHFAEGSIPTSVPQHSHDCMAETICLEVMTTHCGKKW